MWKSVALRIRGATAELEEMGEDTDTVATSTSQLRDLVKAITGFDIMENETQFKSIYDIVVGIGKEWENISDIDRSVLLQKLAGKAQGNALAAALESPELIEQAYAIAEGSEGSAMREQKIWEQSIDARIQKLRASLEVLASDVLDSDMFKGLIDGATKFIDLLDVMVNQLGAFNTLMTGIGGLAFLKNIPNFVSRGKGIMSTESLTEILKGDLGKTFKDKGDIAKYAVDNKLGNANIGKAIIDSGWGKTTGSVNTKELEQMSSKPKSIIADLGDDIDEVQAGILEIGESFDDVVDGADVLENSVVNVATETAGAATATGVLSGEMAVVSGEAAVVEGEMAGVATETTGATAAAGGLTAAFKGMVDALAPIAPLLVAIGAIAGMALYTNWVEADYDRKADKFQDKKSEYEENLQQFEDYQSQIAEIGEEIDEINAKDKLTFTDQAELANLQAQKDELTQLKELQDSIVKDQKKQMSDAAMEALSSTMATTDLSSRTQVMVGTNTKKVDSYTKTDLLTAQNNEIAALQEGEKQLADLQKELTDGQDKLTEGQKTKLQEQIDDQKQYNTDLKESIESRVDTLREYQKSLDTSDTDAAKKYNEIGKALRDTTTAISDAKSPLQTMRKNIESAFTSTDEGLAKSRSELKDYLIEAVNNGQTASEALAGIGLTVEDIDIGDIADGSGRVISAVDSLNAYFDEYKKSADDAKKSAEEALALSRQVDGTFDAVKKAQESENAGANWESMAEWVKGGKELLKKGLVGTDDFQTIAQFMSPKKIDLSKYKFASDAYVDAWKKSYDKVKKYFDTENPFDSMVRFKDDGIAKKIFKEVNSETGEVENQFKTTAEAAKKMGLSVEATEVILDRLKDYGFEFDDVQWSGKQLEEYKTNLESIQQLYDDMEPGAEKDRLGFLLKGFDSQYKIYQEDMDKLDEEAIIHIKFEYDLSQVLSAIQDLQSNILNDPEGFKKYSADYIMNLERARELMEGQTGIDENSKNAQDYAKSYQKIADINKQLHDQNLPEEQREGLLRQKAAMEEVQNAYQQALLNGQEIDWSTFLTGNMEEILDSLPGLTDEARKAVEESLNGTKGNNGGKKPKSDYTRNPLVGKTAEEQRRYYNKHKDEMTDEQKEMYQKSWLEGQGKNAGINKNGNLVDDVDASNKRIDANKKLDESNQKLVDSYLKLDDAKRKGSKEEKALIDAAKKQKTTQDDLVKKYGKTTKAVDEYNTKKKEQNEIDKIITDDKNVPKATSTATDKVTKPSGKETSTKKEQAGTKITPTVDVSKAQKQISELTTEQEAKDIVVNLIGNDEATPMVEAWNLLEAPDKETELTVEDKATAVLTVWNTLSADPKFTSMSAEDKASWVITTWNNLDPKDKEAILKGNNTDAIKKINAIKGMTIPTKFVSVVVSGYTAAHNAINSLKSGLSALKDKVVNIVTNKKTNYTTTGKGGGGNKFANKLHGTAHASGTPSWISGLPNSSLRHTPIDTDNYPSNWQTRKGDNPLVGEVGPEMVVNGNRWWLVGEDGPEFTHIPAHSVVFNSRQTEELLSRGSTSRRGAAHLGGSFDHDLVTDEDEEALIGGTALANGGKLTKYSSSGKSKSSTKKSTKKKSSNKKSSSTRKGNKKKSSKKKSGNAWDSFEKWLSKLFDWIEVHLDRLSEKTEIWTTAAEKAVEAGSDAQKAFYQNAISALGNELNANKTAESKYLAEAQLVGKKGAKAAGIKNSDKWVVDIINKLRNGVLDITEYDEKKQTIIKDIQEWYDKSREAAKAIRDLTDNMQDLYDSLRNIPNVKADEAIDKLAKTLEHLQDEGERNFQYVDTGYSNANSNLDRQTSNLASQRDQRLTAYQTTSGQLNTDRNALNKYSGYSAIAAGLKNSKKIEINDGWSTDVKKAVAAYNASLEANITANQNYIEAQDSYLSAFYENAAKKLENITSWYEAISDKYTSKASEMSTYIDLTKLEGAVYNSGSAVFNNQGTALTNNRNNAKTEYEQYLEEINRQINSNTLKVNTKEYNEAMAELNKLRENYYSAAKELREFNDSLVELDFENLEKKLERLQGVIDRISERNDLAEKTAGRKGALFTQSESAYAEVINADVDKIAVAFEKYNKALAEQKKYTIGSDKWAEFADKVNDARGEIKGLYEDIIDVSDSIREIRWKAFEDGVHKLERVNTELEQIRGFLKEESFLEDNGTFSKEGLANIALYGQMIDNNNGMIDVHRKAIKKLNEEYENGMISLDDLTDQTEEHMDAIHDLASETDDYRQNILDQYLSSLERQNELLNESIDLREKNLDRMKSYYDYQKTIQTKTKDIVYLENQIRALQGTSNENSRAKLASLQNQLVEARSDLADTQYEHEMQVRSDGYDRLRDDAQRALDELTKEVQRNTELQSQIISQMLESTRLNYNDVNAVIQDKVNETGLIISDTTNTQITQLNQVAESLGNLGLAYGDIQNPVQEFANANSIANASLIEVSNAAEKSIQSLKDLQAAYTATQTVMSTDTSKVGGTSATTAQLGGTVSSGAKTTASTTAKTTTTAAKTTTTAASTAAKTTTTAAKTTAAATAKKETVTAANAQKALNTLMSHLKYSSSEGSSWGVFNKELWHKKNFQRKVYVPHEYLLKAYNQMGFNVKDKNFKSADLLNALKKTGAWTYLSQVRTKDKGKVITRPMVPNGAIHGYAIGSSGISSNQFGWTQEKGQELIYRRHDGAVLTPLGKGDKVFTNEMTENLWKMSKIFSDEALKRNVSDINKTHTVNDNRSVSINFDNFINVEGNADQNTLKDMEGVAIKQIDLFEKRIMNGMKLNGYKMRFN